MTRRGTQSGNTKPPAPDDETGHSADVPDDVPLEEDQVVGPPDAEVDAEPASDPESALDPVSAVAGAEPKPESEVLRPDPPGGVPPSGPQEPRSPNRIDDDLEVGELDVVFVKGAVHGAVPAKARYLGDDRWDDLLSDARWMHLSDAVGRAPVPKADEVSANFPKPPRKNRHYLSARDMATLCSVPPMQTQGKLWEPVAAVAVPSDVPPPPADELVLAPAAAFTPAPVSLDTRAEASVAEPVVVVSRAEAPSPSPPAHPEHPEEPEDRPAEPLLPPAKAEALVPREPTAPAVVDAGAEPSVPFDAWGVGEGVWQSHPDTGTPPLEEEPTEIEAAVLLTEPPAEPPAEPRLAPVMVVTPAPPHSLPRQETSEAQPSALATDQSGNSVTESPVVAPAVASPEEHLVVSRVAANQRLLMSGKKLTRSLVFDGEALSLPHSIVVTVTIEPAESATGTAPEEAPASAPVSAVQPPEAGAEPTASAPAAVAPAEPSTVKSPPIVKSIEPVEAQAAAAPKVVISSSPLGFVGDLCAAVGGLIGSLFGTGSPLRVPVSSARAPAGDARAKAQAGRTARTARPASPEVRRSAARRSDGRSR